jgi:hypothetical protein
MLVIVAVDVRIYVPTTPVETYRLYHWAELAAWKANAAAYPTQVIKMHQIEMTEDEERAFKIVVAFAQARKEAEYQPLRKSGKITNEENAHDQGG